MSDETVGIVVGVDGSDPSKLAVQWAAQEAHVRKLPILLAAAYVVPNSSMQKAWCRQPQCLTSWRGKHRLLWTRL